MTGVGEGERDEGGVGRCFLGLDASSADDFLAGSGDELMRGEDERVGSVSGISPPERKCSGDLYELTIARTSEGDSAS